MDFIIFDLEWNNAYNYKTKQGINEIIEIGAIRLNPSLEIIDTFKQLIKPTLSKKLGSRFKNLTHITMQEIKENGISFDEAFSDFARWSSGDVVFMSWSNSDLYTLIGNYKKFKGTSNIDFMGKYADAQKYCMSFIKDRPQGVNQIGLANCAEKFGVNTDDTSFHRALEDCWVTAKCFEKVYDKKKFNEYICLCNTDFFERLIYKSHYISEPVSDEFNVYEQQLYCPVCKGVVRPAGEYEFMNNTFRNAGICRECGKKFWIQIRAKKTYDDIVVSKKLFRVNKKRAKYIK